MPTRTPFSLPPQHPKCRGCPAWGVGRSFVPATGPADAALAFIGQGPGEQEARTGVPFHPQAPAGSMFTKELSYVDLDRTNVYIDNIVRCWLPSNREPTRAEALHCYRTHWGPSLPSTLKLVVAVGMPAARFLCGPEVGERWVGSLLERELPSLEATT